jgi:hypothetical protein
MEEIKIPTEEDIDNAEIYAEKKLCEYLGNKFGTDYLVWNSEDSTCRITENGCDSSKSANPFSKKMFDTVGNINEYSPKNYKYGELWKFLPPRDMYWKLLEDGTHGCGYSDSIFKRFCTVPETRASSPQRGVTNVTPFKFIQTYDKEKCEIVSEYCTKDKGISYDSSKKECYIPPGQKVAEFFTGTTLIRDARSSDKRLKDNIKVHKTNFLDNLTLYTFTWNETAQLLYNKPKNFIDIGLIADDLNPNEKYYDEYGYLCINFDEKTDRMKHIKLFYTLKYIIYNNGRNKDST